MKTTLTSREVAAIKRIAININPLVEKLNKLKPIVDDLQAQIDAQCSYFTASTGKSINELIIKKVLPQFDAAGNPKYNEKGVQLKTARYEINPEVLVWNELQKVYDIVDKDALCSTVGNAKVDFEEKVSEIETAPADAPFNPIEGAE